jgi:hypothetical protein
VLRANARDWFRSRLVDGKARRADDDVRAYAIKGASMPDSDSYPLRRSFTFAREGEQVLFVTRIAHRASRG